jgi:hypothetical protein
MFAWLFVCRIIFSDSQLFMVSAVKVVLSLSTSQNSSDLDTNYLTTKDLGIAQLLRV